MNSLPSLAVHGILATGHDRPGARRRDSNQFAGRQRQLLGKRVTSVSLLGHQGASLRWTQQADALVISAPSTTPFASAVTFNIR